MTDHATLLREAAAAVRPMIEDDIDKREIYAAWRKRFSDAGLDWMAFKSLQKARVEDDRDESGEGKRVAKIMDRLDCTAAYAEMLGYGAAKMNENNCFSTSYSEAKGRGFIATMTDEQRAAALAYDGEDSPVGELTDNQENHHDTDSGQRVGRADDEQRDAARVSSAVGCREGDDEGLEGQGGGVHGTPAYRRRQSGTGQAGEPRVEHRADQDRGSRHVGGEARNEVAAQDDVGATASSTNSHSHRTPARADMVEASTEKQAAGASRPTPSNSAAHSPAERAGEAPSSSQASPATDTDDDGDDDVPAFIKQNKPDCLKLKDGHCRLSFATSALCAECNQRRAMARALA